MNKAFLLLLFFLAAAVSSHSKSVYIPLYLQNTGTNDGAQLSYSKTTL